MISGFFNFFTPPTILLFGLFFSRTVMKRLGRDPSFFAHVGDASVAQVFRRRVDGRIRGIPLGHEHEADLDRFADPRLGRSDTGRRKDLHATRDPGQEHLDPLWGLGDDLRPDVLLCSLGEVPAARHPHR